MMVPVEALTSASVGPKTASPTIIAMHSSALTTR
jgi:hypothetical protein